MAQEVDQVAATLHRFGEDNTLYNEGYGSKWNPEGKPDNCVWVSVSRFFNHPVPEWSSMVSAAAPPGGASVGEIAHFIRQTCTMARCYMKDVEPTDIFYQGTLVCYSRPDGSGHCVLQREGRYMCFQHSDDGIDLSDEVNDPDNTIFYCWTFVDSVY
ncbi:hypothetical protein LT330_000066 [Penicillium expansum]|uniref:Uncharacterized protein n=1 Tax=Penicillium expansum TaxID=27334 RepID=A0A0A2IKG5_PENEN|nr:hypothetical protein PEX2_004360 [Penicillium expansum]KAJ5499145.1 hypothetical protein N7453_008196 [Penicillium expansum]KAK4870829.1 hypothetical protein LT330_000066 [Penicillium expansum]KGO42961.1 hypothetical protein PEXP_027100 [Penicillium expansum]KGO57082.1 hypothetical protein PEX2_004360 [Penicillium expansum]KGO66279.1 hypothetical protein PEX1_052840 [Penicillium expansum]